MMMTVVAGRKIAQHLRFYPAHFPPIALEPTKEKFAIRKTEEGMGEGVVSLAAFKSGDTVFAFTGIVSEVITQFTLHAGDAHIHDPFFMGKILHSCEPNCSVDTRLRTFTAIKNIAPGDYVTMDYAQTEPVLFKPFACSCGAQECRKYILGYAQEVRDTTPQEYEKTAAVVVA